MKTGDEKDISATELRHRAEKRLGETQAATGPHPKNEDTLKLIHELQVHQIELEMQNEELMQARAEIEVSLEKYSDLYDFAPAGYFTLTEDGIIREVNLTGAALLGQDRSRLINRHFGLFLSDEAQPAFVEFIRKVFGGTAKEKCEVMLSGNKDNPRYIHIEGTAVETGKGMGWQCRMIAMDITDQKLSEKSLRQKTEELDRFFSVALDLLCIVDADGYFRQLNQAWERTLGFTREEIMSKRFFDLIHPDDVEKTLGVFTAQVSQREGANFINRYRCKNGSYRLLEWRSVPAGNLIYAAARDITERERIAEALQNAHTELESRVEERTVELKDALTEIKAMKDQLETENIFFREENKMKYQFSDILGESSGLKNVLFRAEHVAPMNTTVLILGETGTGKELVASAIHNMSPRKDRPLIFVNCAALPANLIESELFGREKGAFTGADIRRVGRFEIANGSTICLDEIGELPLEIQAKLLRVIQDNKFERLGSSQTITVDVRIVATTNRNLMEEVRNGRFRQDLYYRLNVFSITVPPLREREEDIPLLVEVFTERYSRKLGKRITSIPKDTMKALQDYSWPGNIRELENVIERAVILCPGTVLHLVDELDISFSPSSSTARTLEEIDRNQILKILSETKWRIDGKDGAAAILGLHPSTLRARMHKLKIFRPEIKEPE